MPVTPLPPSVLRKISELDHCEMLASGPYTWTFGIKGKILRPVPNNLEFVPTEVVESILNDAEISEAKYERLLAQAKDKMGILHLGQPASNPPESAPSSEPNQP